MKLVLCLLRIFLLLRKVFGNRLWGGSGVVIVFYGWVFSRVFFWEVFLEGFLFWLEFVSI